MREEFLDECKEKLFEFLEDHIGETYRNVSYMLNEAKEYISDDYIYYRQGSFAREHYSDELGDQFSNHPELYLEQMKGDRDLNPFTDEFTLCVLRDAICDMVDVIVGELFSDEQYFSSITLDQVQLVLMSEGLDVFGSYPYYKHHLYSTEFDDYYFQNKVNKRFGLPLTIEDGAVEATYLKKSDILEEAEQTLGEDRKKDIVSNEEQGHSKGLKI